MGGVHGLWVRGSPLGADGGACHRFGYAPRAGVLIRPRRRPSLTSSRWAQPPSRPLRLGAPLSLSPSAGGRSRTAPEGLADTGHASARTCQAIARMVQMGGREAKAHPGESLARTLARRVRLPAPARRHRPLHRRPQNRAGRAAPPMLSKLRHLAGISQEKRGSVHACSGSQILRNC